MPVGKSCSVARIVNAIASTRASELVAGLSLVPFVFEPPLAVAFAAVTLSSFFIGPLTVWAQTVRM
ncbi:MAG TPA: hypothetical protein VE444_00400, partial [Gaiellaceae bacterium]|nr:hypothetical protein [Gaiellaceae bacterium]